MITQEKLGTVESALSTMPRSSLSHDEFFQVLLALRSLGEDGVQIASTWMQKPQNLVREKFSRFKRQNISIGTLFYLAKQKGWKGDKETRYQGLFQLTPGKVINARYITEALSAKDLEGTKVLGIRSEKGTGKTEFIERVLMPLISEEELLISVGHRRTLLSQAAKRLGLDYYQDLDTEKLSQCFRLAITLDSLMSIKKMRTDIGMVIIDEASQVFNHLLGETVAKERWNVQTTLTYLIRKARYVVLLD